LRLFTARALSPLPCVHINAITHQHLAVPQNINNFANLRTFFKVIP
jgi:hypothetical protein